MGILNWLRRDCSDADGERLLYLRKYHRDVEIFHGSIRELQAIPSVWRDILLTGNQQARKAKLLSVWRQYAGDSLQNTIAYLSEHLLNISLISHGGTYALLYTIKNAKGETLYYEGGNPKAQQWDESLEKDWNRVPASIRRFYEGLHNGFFYYASGAMGLAERREILRLSDESWGILDELPTPPPYHLDHSFCFFTTGAGGYCAVDVSNPDSEQDAFLWFSARQPRYHVRFWDVVDTWMVIGFDT